VVVILVAGGSRVVVPCAAKAARFDLALRHD
jgi:hypothetical protein